MDVDTALAEVPVNIMPLLDDTDFKSRETTVAYNAGGMDLVWNFITTAGAYTQTAVTPTTGGNYDWAHQGDGMYSIEIPASGGASINNDTEGFGWFTGIATGVLPWRGPTIGFRAAGLNNVLVDDAYSATRGLTGTALPAAAADAAGGLPISDAGGLDLDSKLANTNEVTAARMGALTDWINGGRLDLIIDAIQACTDRLTAARAQVLDDWINAGRLDNILDARASQTSVDTIDGIVDTIVARIVGTIAAGTHNPQSGDAYARLGAPAGASVSADVAAVKSDTAAILVDTGTTLQGELDGIQADTEDIQSRIPAALVSGRIDASVGAMASNVITATAINTGAITAAKFAAGAIDASAVADGAIDAATFAVGAIDATAIADGAIDAATFAAGAITASAIAADAIGASELAATATAEIADAVWDELVSGHAIEGSAGAALSAAGGSGDPWSTVLPGAYGAGTAGKIIGDNLNAPVATVDTVVDGLATELAKVPKSDGAASWNATALAAIQSEATDALNAYDPPTKAEMDTGHSSLATAAALATVDTVADAILVDTGTDLPAAITALNDVSTAEVQTACDAALSAAISEPANLSATKSVKSLLYWVFGRFFHRTTQTATQQITYKADGTTALATRTVSDDGTTQVLGAGS